MSISSQAFHSSQKSASRAPALAKPFIASNRAARHHEHQLPKRHEHQLPSLSFQSVVSIARTSSQAFHSSGPAKPFIASNRAARHHEHQLPSPSRHPTRQASIMSISSQAFHSSQRSTSREPALKPFIPAASQAFHCIQPGGPAS